MLLSMTLSRLNSPMRKFYGNRIWNFYFDISSEIFLLNRVFSRFVAVCTRCVGGIYLIRAYIRRFNSIFMLFCISFFFSVLSHIFPVCCCYIIINYLSNYNYSLCGCVYYQYEKYHFLTFS